MYQSNQTWRRLESGTLVVGTRRAQRVWPSYEIFFLTLLVKGGFVSSHVFLIEIIVQNFILLESKTVFYEITGLNFFINTINPQLAIIVVIPLYHNAISRLNKSHKNPNIILLAKNAIPETKL